MKAASEAKIDYVTFDGAGGGTGMSPVPMMDEMSMPTVYLEAQVLRCAELLQKKGKHVPDLIMAGGFIKESQVFKAIAMSNLGNGPYVKAINMARSPLTASFKGSYFVELAEKGQLPKVFAERYGTAPEKFLVAAFDLRKRFGARAKEIPWEAMAVCGYFDRLRVGLQQLMAGCRKWKLNLINRNDIFALTERASRITGIPLAEDTEKDAIERILG
jgi:glutamate synthase domain-containing protein 2